MQQRRALYPMIAALLIIVVVLTGCGVNAPAQAEPGRTTDILPTPQPMPESRQPPTPTPPAAPTAGPGIAGAQTLLRTDFSNDADIANWKVVDGYDALSGPSIWKITGGRLEQVSDPDGSPGQYQTALITGNASWKDYQVSVNAFNTGNDEIGLAFRANKQGYYVFRLLPSASSTANYLISRFDASAVTFTKIAQAKGKGFETDRWYQLSVKVQGDHIQAFVDGQPVLEAHDSTLAQGGAGVYGFAQGNLTFDNFSVQALSGN
jgi:hypothetical protein